MFEKLSSYGHEHLVYCHDSSSGLHALIGIHSTVLGPATGGVRFWHYENEEAALKDVLRLSQGMTYKSALANLAFGGGKAVILAPKDLSKAPGIFARFGECVERLKGLYYTAKDVNISHLDIEAIHQQTSYVLGLPPSMGGGGDPSPVTAYGVYLGIKASAKRAFGSSDLSGRRILVQGVGSVGEGLLALLEKENATLLITDIDAARLRAMEKKFRVEVVPTEGSMYRDIDIFVPCALGGILHEESISKLRCRVVAGAANNQLRQPSDAQILKDRGIIYAPDFLINSGGIILVYYEYNKASNITEAAYKHTEQIYDTLETVYDISEKENISSHEAAMKEAGGRIDAKRSSSLRAKRVMSKS